MTRDISSGNDVLDVRDIIARVEELEGEYDTAADKEDEAERLEELNKLNALLDELCGNGGDKQWRGDWYPITLIRDSYFVEAMEEDLKSLGYLPKDMPWWIEIDMDKTAANMQQDYSSVDYDGETYWYR